MAIVMLLEGNQLEQTRETAKTLRWDCYCDGVKFSLYIPKWRVPSPAPSEISVQVVPRRVESEDLPNLSQTDVEHDPTLALEPIIATVTMYEKKTETVRYQPVGNKSDWEIGEPYVPNSMTYEKRDRLRVSVFWGAQGGESISAR